MYVSLALALTMLRFYIALASIDSHKAVYSLHRHEKYRVAAAEASPAAVSALSVIVLFVLRSSFVLYSWGLDVGATVGAALIVVSGVIFGADAVPIA